MNSLVKSYKNAAHSVDGKLREQIIMDYAPLVRYVAQRIASRLPANIDIDDLISAGVIGLMDAIEKFDMGKENKFKTYAEHRIRGAILDELRSQDWVPRSVRDLAKKIERALAKIEQELGRVATDEEASIFMGLTLDEYYRVVARTKLSTVISIDAPLDPSGDEGRTILDSLEQTVAGNASVLLDDKTIRESLMKTIESLPERDQLVLSLYYFEQLNLKEIGKVLNITESRVSQVHQQALTQLRRKWQSNSKD